MHLLNPLPPPLQPPEWRRSKNPNLHSHSSSTLLSNHMNPNKSRLLMPANRSTTSFMVKKILPTSNATISETGTPPELKRSWLDVSSQLSRDEKRGMSMGKSLLERMGMKQLSLLEHLGMPIKG